jgi:hypothetical protein
VVNTVFGSSQDASGPFVCPGGLFASSQYLWVNDQSFGQADPGCGARGDVGSAVGANITARPGFGGLFVEDAP